MHKLYEWSKKVLWQRFWLNLCAKQVISARACANQILPYNQGWPEPYIYTIYDRIFGDFLAKNTVYTPYIYGSAQPYIYTALTKT